MTTIRRKAIVALLLASLVLLLLPQPAWAPRTFRALISIAGPCATPDGLRGSFTGSALIQRFESRGGSSDAPTALVDLAGVCTDGTTFVPMKPMTVSLEVHIRASTCDALDFTLAPPVDTEAFVTDLTNSHTVFVPITKKDRRSLCTVARTLSADKGTDRLVRDMNRLIGVRGTG